MSEEIDVNFEILECSRYGEDEDLHSYLVGGGDANAHDEGGTTALHKAAANGHVCFSSHDIRIILPYPLLGRMHHYTARSRSYTLPE